MKYILLLCLLTLSGCTIGYKISSDSVSWVHWNEGTGKVITELEVKDPDSFVILNSSFAKDTEKVFYDGQEIKGADPESFIILSQTYSSDKSSVYFMNILIKGVAPTKIEPIGINYAVINDGVYYRNFKIKGARPDTFKISNFKNSNVYKCYLVAHWYECKESYIP